MQPCPGHSSRYLAVALPNACQQAQQRQVVDGRMRDRRPRSLLQRPASCLPLLAAGLGGHSMLLYDARVIGSCSP